MSNNESTAMLLTYQQCRQFDQIAINEFGIPGIVLMENAGASCVRELAKRALLKPAIILCGAGNNGGDGFVIARHLHNAGVTVRICLLCESSRINGDAKTNFDIATK